MITRIELIEIKRSKIILNKNRLKYRIFSLHTMGSRAGAVFYLPNNSVIERKILHLHEITGQTSSVRTRYAGIAF